MIALRTVTRQVPVAHSLLTIVRDVSLQVEPGERVAIIGKSGSGKSTLLNLLGGLDTPTSGDVWLNGRNWRQLNSRDRAAHRLHSIGMIFQSFQLLPSASAIDNVMLPLMLAGIPRRERIRRAEAMLDLVGLSMRRSHFPSTLSGGEQQRVAIARALIHRPPVILADEPTGNLDSATTVPILNLLREQVEQFGTTCVLVTHDADIPTQFADRTVVMHDGELRPWERSD
ncbi:ABC transporter ATP-binding protein [Tuwongella immobilis]|uniref:ABC transporter domain-containing protein n=1 Tax=Tuwongella immobilis TaxID=692036 RepID=A0A6C2YQK2_9BACT|nr:ABC transporter ATP-binding protein [Tuwongella immobilis]VIP03674.1 abc atp-binding protein : ABC-type antimicrobial peptide transport system, ATPase component OS=Owenweeksia hongkongensis (strain DSM 17368 / JCM 12287 / NRRL B-23963) GN=Oweho_2601 PE=3 SV=1: ABC_tran [Tuwongella immobilis]VTS04716.1 abc atp-binding protein : ABC-type antimicrobial peptide transport system, ATPase component OS=Owenweeksia hongkongensis (strain DSM 17368 / JCM 12287 / NRRL B-23963) GN=Oweho_2601 PE=3 SV=1: ABC